MTAGDSRLQMTEHTIFFNHNPNFFQSQSSFLSSLIDSYYSRVIVLFCVKQTADAFPDEPNVIRVIFETAWMFSSPTRV